MSVPLKNASALLVACLALTGLAAPAGAASDASQIAWVRQSAGEFIAAELAGNGAAACGRLTAAMRATRNHRTCQQRWDARLRGVLREEGERARLRAQQRALRTATITIHGDWASIALPTPLLGSTSELQWTENCWMVTG